jgi:hypothetical protein
VIGLEETKPIEKPRRNKYDIVVSEEVWRFLWGKKLEWRYKKMDDVIRRLIAEAGYKL